MLGIFGGTHNGKPVVLHVDDEKDILELVAVILERIGVEVISSANGAEALQAAHKFKPALALIDILMPGMDGFDLCRRLKAAPALKAMPILMVTALDQIKDVEKALAAGAVGYITKPFEPAKMRIQISEILDLPTPG